MDRNSGGNSTTEALTDIFTVEEEISKEISAKLRLRLSDEQKKKLSKRHTDNTEAYQLYLKGRYYWNKRTDSDLKKSIQFFQQAIAKDPDLRAGTRGFG